MGTVRPHKQSPPKPIFSSEQNSIFSAESADFYSRRSDTKKKKCNQRFSPITRTKIQTQKVHRGNSFIRTFTLLEYADMYSTYFRYLFFISLQNKYSNSLLPQTKILIAGNFHVALLWSTVKAFNLNLIRWNYTQNYFDGIHLIIIYLKTLIALNWNSRNQAHYSVGAFIFRLG